MVVMFDLVYLIEPRYCVIGLSPIQSPIICIRAMCPICEIGFGNDVLNR